MFWSRCADTAVSGNPELFILFQYSRYNPNIFHLQSFIIYIKWASPLIFYKRKDVKDSLHVKTYFCNQPRNPLIYQPFRFCSRIMASTCLEDTKMMSCQSGIPLAAGYISSLSIIPRPNGIFYFGARCQDHISYIVRYDNKLALHILGSSTFLFLYPKIFQCRFLE